MTISRRKFVKAGMLVAAVAAVPASDVLGRTKHGRNGIFSLLGFAEDDPLANYTKSSFVSYINSVFQVQTTNGTVDFTLTNVNDVPSPTGGEAFSLVFHGGSEALAQNTYGVTHAALGTFQLFLVPGGSDQNGAHICVATINRVPPA